VFSVAEELVPGIKGKIIRGLETIIKTTGTEYKMVIMEHGIVNQVTLFVEKTSNAVSLISTAETSVAERITAITKKTVVETTLDIKTIQSQEITSLVQTLITEDTHNFDSTTTVIEGSLVDVGYFVNYELTVTSSDHITKTVQITREKSTNRTFIKDVRPIFIRPVPKPIINY
jgi:hypothetical protein